MSSLFAISLLFFSCRLGDGTDVVPTHSIDERISLQMQYDAEARYARRAWQRISLPIVSVYYRNAYAQHVEQMRVIREKAAAYGIAIRVSKWESNSIANNCFSTRNRIILKSDSLQ